MFPRCHIVSPVDRDDGGSMNAEDLVITFKRNMAKLSRAERRRAIESVRDVHVLGRLCDGRELWHRGARLGYGIDGLLLHDW